MCWSFDCTVPLMKRVWEINLLFAVLKWQTVQGWREENYFFYKGERECVCALRKRKPAVSHRCDKLVWFSSLFFAILQRTATRGERNEKIILWEELVSNDLLSLLRGYFSFFLPIASLFVCQQFEVSESVCRRHHALPDTEFLPCIKQFFSPPLLK